jgi:hypothetical protein
MADGPNQSIKDTYAHFGLAMYHANVLEDGLARVLLQSDYMTKVRDEFVRTQGTNFDKDKFAAEFDDYLEKRYKETMGRLVVRVKEFQGLSENLKKRIDVALARRNHLAHGYWRAAAIDFMTEDGRAKMIVELQKDADTFEQLEKDIHEAMKATREKLGIREEVLDARVEKRMADVKAGLCLK